MNNLKTLVINNQKIVISIQFFALLSLSVIAPFIGNQFITGIIVNSILLISTIVLGLRAGILISIFPSLIAFVLGTLPMFFGPIIPFIIFSNILLVIIFNYYNGNNYWTRSFLAGLVKFVFLYLSNFFIFNLILKKEIAHGLSNVMGVNQLVTVLGGIILTFFIIKFLNISYFDKGAKLKR